MPTWALVLEAARLDPLRALEIELRCFSDDASAAELLWWERYMVYRRALPRQDTSANEPARTYLPITPEKRPFVLHADGRLIPQ